MDTQQ